MRNDVLALGVEIHGPRKQAFLPIHPDQNANRPINVLLSMVPTVPPSFVLLHAFDSNCLRGWQGLLQRKELWKP